MSKRLTLCVVAALSASAGWAEPVRAEAPKKLDLKKGSRIVLIGNGVFWFATGYYMYSWDAFLWIFGFWAIELNLAEWEVDRTREIGAAEGLP